KTLLNLLGAMRSIFKADRVCLLTPDKNADNSWLVPMQSTSDAFSHIHVSPMQVSDATHALFQSTLSASQPLLIAAEDSPEFKKEYAIQSQLVFSIHSKVGKSWLIALHRCASNEIWTDNQCRVLAAIADRVTDVLDAWQLNETLEGRTDQYKQLVDNMPDGVIILQDRRIVFANEVMQDMLDEEDEQQYLGKNIEEYILPAFIAISRKQITAALSGKRNPILEIQIKAQDGYILDVVSSCMAISYQGEPAVQIIMRDVTRRNQLDKVLHQSLKDNQHLARQMINIQEQERVAIAQDLHDDSGQLLTAMSINLKSIKNNIHEEKLRRRLEETESMVNRLFKSIRSSLETLNPTHIDVLGLEDAILSELEVWSVRYGIEVNHHIAIGDHAPSSEIATTIFRVTQEALTNIAKYAKASHIDVSLRLSKQDAGMLQLQIQDHGVGFDSNRSSNHNSYGILGMQTRTQLISGTFHLTSEVNIGTTIHADFPVDITHRTTQEVHDGQ
ncbi:MAG: histidine kinase, partial [Ghiorsea sp.]